MHYKPTLMHLLAGLSYGLSHEFLDRPKEDGLKLFLTPPLPKLRNIKSLLEFIGMNFLEEERGGRPVVNEWIQDSFLLPAFSVREFDGRKERDKRKASFTQDEIGLSRATSKVAADLEGEIGLFDTYFVTDPETKNLCGLDRVTLRRKYAETGRVIFHQHKDLYSRICQAIYEEAKRSRERAQRLGIIFSFADPNAARLIA